MIICRSCGDSIHKIRFRNFSFTKEMLAHEISNQHVPLPPCYTVDSLPKHRILQTPAPGRVEETGGRPEVPREPPKPREVGNFRAAGKTEIQVPSPVSVREISDSLSTLTIVDDVDSSRLCADTSSPKIHRRTPALFIPPPPYSKSALKKKKMRLCPRSKGVRGLWGEKPSNRFSDLQDELLYGISSFLDPTSLGSICQASRRWNAIASSPRAWSSVDATEVLNGLSSFYSPLEAGERLDAFLTKRRPTKLTIRSIGIKLDPKQCLPPLQGVTDLHLADFARLTDTHLRVMLLGATTRVHRNSLRKLKIENCPLLTNAAVESVRRICPNIEYTAFEGCPLISNELNTRRKAILNAHSSLFSLFAPP